MTSFTGPLYSSAVHVSLLHGFVGDPSAWDATIAAGLGELEPVAIRLPGHGLPVRDTWQANLDAIDLGRSMIAIGYSFGARIALGLLAQHRILGAILIGVNPGLPDETPEQEHDRSSARAARRIADAQWARLLRERGLHAFLDAWEAQPLFATQARVSPARLAERRARRLALDPEELARCLEVMGLAEMPDYAHVIARGDCTLVVGADDAKFVEIAAPFREHVIVREIAGAGHDVLLEQPVALARVLVELTARLT